MNRWSSLVGLLACLLSVAVAVSYFSARHYSRLAGREVRLVTEQASEAQEAALLADVHRRDRLSALRLEEQAADLEVGAAERNGVGSEKAKLHQRLAAESVRQAEGDSASQRDLARMEPDSGVATAEDRVEAASQGQHGWQSVMERDVRLTYIAGMLWMVFGIALLPKR